MHQNTSCYSLIIAVLETRLTGKSKWALGILARLFKGRQAAVNSKMLDTGDPSRQIEEARCSVAVQGAAGTDPFDVNACITQGW